MIAKTTNKWKWFLLLNVLALFFLIFAFGREYVGNLQVEKQIARLQAEKSDLEKQKLSTLDLMQSLSSEYYLEKEARTKQGLGAPGETLIVIEDQAALPENDSATVEQLPNYRRWFYYFFNRVEYERLTKL
jgi:cell division protein FtsB